MPASTRGLVCKMHLRMLHTSIQVQPDQPGIPCTMVLRLMPRSPWRRIRLASIAGELTARIARSGFANLRRLDASNGRQDHMVLPYAASSAKNFNQPSADTTEDLGRRLSAVRLRAMFAHGSRPANTSRAQPLKMSEKAVAAPMCDFSGAPSNRKPSEPESELSAPSPPMSAAVMLAAGISCCLCSLVRL